MKNYIAALATAVAFAAVPAFAGEPLFGYVPTTDTMPKGEWEFEQWMTRRATQSQGKYNQYFLRSEIENGVTDRFQLSGYLNYYRVNADKNGVDGATTGNRVPENAPPSTPFRETRVDSASIEGIYRLLSPYVDRIGVALYSELTYGKRRQEWENKLILQKNFLDDRLVWVGSFNLNFEREIATGDPNADPESIEFQRRWTKENELEFISGISYRFAPNWFAGGEYRHRYEHNGWTFSSAQRERSSNFFGPNLHFADQKWFFTLTWLHQLPNARCYNADDCSQIVGGRSYGGEHEKNEVRLKVGFPF